MQILPLNCCIKYGKLQIFTCYHAPPSKIKSKKKLFTLTQKQFLKNISFCMCINTCKFELIQEKNIYKERINKFVGF